jgi:hypothetical protein
MNISSMATFPHRVERVSGAKGPREPFNSLMSVRQRTVKQVRESCSHPAGEAAPRRSR